MQPGPAAILALSVRPAASAAGLRSRARRAGTVADAPEKFASRPVRCEGMIVPR
jgi:hypothetical protein